jgi:hypothetical protein
MVIMNFFNNIGISAVIVGILLDINNDAWSGK